MFAARFQLSNLVFIVDRNHFQAYGSDEEVLNMGDLEEKFKSFGCHAVTVDGHNYEEIVSSSCASSVNVSINVVLIHPAPLMPVPIVLHWEI